MMGSAADFDFYVGTWQVHNRRLRSRLTGCDEWEEFPAVSVARTILGGKGNLDEITFPTLGAHGMTVRLYDAEADEWRLYWISQSSAVIDVPVRGRWDDPTTGRFYCDDVHEGTPVRVRYLWLRTGEDAVRWEQAFSVDGERTWETNWIMESARTA
jgi:hypothetical protein